MMSQTEISRLRAHLTLKGESTKTIADHFGVGKSAVNQIITGDAVSARIQKYITDKIGFWPEGWKKKGAPRPT